MFPLDNLNLVRGLSLITYVPRGMGRGVKSLIHFHCVLHAKRGEGVQIAYKIAYVLNGWSLWGNLNEKYWPTI